MRFEGKVALVTGAASGIGAGVADRLHKEGATVIVADLSAKSDDQSNQGMDRRALDVTCEAAWAEVVIEIERDFGRLDVLVNNAGIGINASLLDLSLEKWRAILAVNLDGVFLGMKACIPALHRTGGGAIVNVASVLSKVATVNAAAYCASKGGVESLTRAAALEMAAADLSVRINSIHPGYIETPLLVQNLSCDPGRKDTLLASIPDGRLGSVEEIAAAVAFLASDDASYMNGSQLVIDGALTAR